MAEKIQVEYEAKIDKLQKDLKKLEKQQTKIATGAKKTSQEIQKGGDQRAKQLTKLIKLREKLVKAGVNPKRAVQLNKEIALLQKAGTATKKLTQETKKIQKQTTGFEKTLKRVGAALLFAFSTQALLRFGKELNKTAIQMQAFSRRAEIVFGESIKLIREFANENAIALGLTRNEFEGAAAAIGDMIVPLGFSRQKAAEMSVQLLRTGIALKEFTTDSRSASEISDILARALTGEVESLKPLGVSIDQTSKEFKDLIKTKMRDEGVTILQAKSLAIYEFTLQRSADAIRSLEINTESLSLKQRELGAIIREVKEVIAEEATPFLISMTTSLLAQANVLKSDLIPGWRKWLSLTSAFGLADATTDIRIFESAIEDAAEALKGLTEEQLKGSRALQSVLDELASAGIKTKEAREILKGLVQDRLAEIKALKDAADGSSDAIAEEIRNIFFLKRAIKDLTDERGKQGASLQRIAEINKELKPLEEELAILLDKQKKKVSETDEAWKKLNNTLKQDFKDAISSATDGFRELDLEFDAILANLDAFGQRIEQINTLAEIRFENIGLQFEAAGVGVQSLSNIQQQATDARIEQLKELGLAQEDFRLQSERIRREGEQTQRALFALDKLLATASVIIDLQRELSGIAANPALLLLPPAAGLARKAALSANARLAAGTRIAAIAATAVAGFAEGEIDIKGGKKGKDSIPALLMPHESILTEKATGKYKDELTAANNLNLENMIENKYVLPAIRKIRGDEAFMQRWMAENAFDDTGIVRAIKKPVSIKNVDELSSAIAKKQSRYNYFKL